MSKQPLSWSLQKLDDHPPFLDRSIILLFQGNASKKARLKRNCFVTGATRVNSKVIIKFATNTQGV